MIGKEPELLAGAVGEPVGVRPVLDLDVFLADVDARPVLERFGVIRLGLAVALDADDFKGHLHARPQRPGIARREVAVDATLDRFAGGDDGDRLGHRQPAVAVDGDVASVVDDPLRGRRVFRHHHRIVGRGHPVLGRRALLLRAADRRARQQQQRSDPGPGTRRSRDASPHVRTSGTARSTRALDLEEVRQREAEGAGDEVRRERLDDRVVVAHGAVVVAPRHLQVVLHLGEPLLQLEEALAGAQLRIGLGDGQQAAKLSAEGVLAVLQARATRARRRAGA